MSGPKESDKRNYAYLNRLTQEQLMELLLTAPVPPTCCEDEAYVDALEEAILKKEAEHPTDFFPDTAQQWRKFQEFYAPEEDLLPEEEINALVHHDQKTFSEPHHHRLRKILRVGLTAAAIAACLFGTMVAAQAAGVDVFGAIGRWTEETFHFSPSPAAAARNQSYFEAIDQALKSCGIEEDLAPTWFPDGFQMEEPDFSYGDAWDFINIGFENSNQSFFCICITKYHATETPGSKTFEKDKKPVEEYTSNGKTFYIFSNIDIMTATWSNGVIVEEISGNLTIDELKHIIDSMRA